ncbi:hypothetical protein THIOM_005489 [Candidatus Thiomargarita nelsonii]|uniref:Uncharacterized protein n=1 Tax=Candidatus Thiomargarita nelsonii TaxID=1003181 RepID=A0A176RT20_9GAMM|nr:hypothetical protein THIOM_005489 [Candidatus Thiomargarita nelsonii]
MYLSELRKAQVSASNNNGKCIIAASHDGVSTGFDWEYFSRLHVGATAWFLFAEMGYNPYWNSFNSDNGLVQVEAMGLKSPYAVGDTVQIDLVEITPPRSERVDLWEAIELSTGEFLFKTPSPPMSFSLTQQAVKTSIENTETTHRLLYFVVPEGISGHYTLYTAYVQQGENPVKNSSSIRSNLVILPITLENR